MGILDTKVVNVRDHITAEVRKAARFAAAEVLAEEARLHAAGQKVAGPFARFVRAIRAGWAAFIVTIRG